MKILIINELSGFTLDSEYSIQRDSADLLYVSDNNCKRYELSDLLDDDIAVLTDDTIYKAVIRQLHDLDEPELLRIYTEYADENNYERVYYFDGDIINEMFDKPSDLLAVMPNDFNCNHDYFVFDGYGNIKTFNYLLSDDSPIYAHDLTNWIIKQDKIAEYNLDVIELLEWQDV